MITDEDLHVQGLDRLAGYRVVITGSHPEYWSAAMLDALEAYLADGGRLMYLGGNGFYWVTAWDPQRALHHRGSTRDRQQPDLELTSR